MPPGPGRPPGPGGQNAYPDAWGHDGFSGSGGAAGYGPGFAEEAGHDDGESDYHDGPAPSPGEGGGRKAKKTGKRPGKQAKRRGGAGKPPAPGAGRPKGAPGGKGPKLYFGAAAVLGLVVLLGLGAVFVLRGDDRPEAGGGGAAGTRIGTPAETGVSPASYSSSASSAAYSGIASRKADPDPLTIEEVFPSAAAKVAVPDGDVRVRLRAKRLDGDCADAVWGATVAEVLGEGGCTQAARGIYSDTRNGYGLAVAVFNLSTSAEADRFVAALEKTIGGGFVRPLEAPAPLDGFGRGFGMARGLAMGHFAVVTWAQRLDGKGDAEDETLLSLLIEGGENPAVLGRAARSAD
ncbi:hypothetical protein E1200_25065 [Actinomadura sp. GC306]|uniref:hypothetical protein n=1 Tax=Actinomadura sp. GC306 TaxID=2530367 RepID=UPI00104A3787|nr:hypothetical protein [Actinomadura sp. GC306]TDC62625.1 hypothetical protein E1200_25065 [Actinomadura sp. GC306]